MSKTQILNAFYLASQTVPFLMITVTFIALAYAYGHALTPFCMDESFDLVRLSGSFPH